MVTVYYAQSSTYYYTYLNMQDKSTHSQTHKHIKQTIDSSCVCDEYKEDIFSEKCWCKNSESVFNFRLSNSKKMPQAFYES